MPSVLLLDVLLLHQSPRVRLVQSPVTSDRYAPVGLSDITDSALWHLLLRSLRCAGSVCLFVSQSVRLTGSALL